MSSSRRGKSSPNKRRHNKIKSRRLTYETFLVNIRSFKKIDELVASGNFKSSSKIKNLKKRIRVFRSKSGCSILNRLTKFNKLCYNVNIEASLLSYYLDYMEHLLVNHGVNRACKILKDLSSYALRYSSRHISSPVKHVSSEGDDYFPKVLKPFKKYLDGNYNEIMAIITIFDLHRLYGTGNVIPDESGIIKEGVLPKEDPTLNIQKPGRYFDRLYKKTLDPYWLKVKLAWVSVLEDAFPKKKLIDRVDSLKSLSTIHISSKRGPNGPCIPGSIPDFLAILSSVCSDGETLLDKIKQMSSLTMNFSLNSLIKFFEKQNDENRILGQFTSCYTGKLSVKQEVSGKSRLIALVDFFTQSALKGMHLDHFSWLKRQKEDSTVCQNKAFQFGRSMSSNSFSESEGMGSDDLTEATNGLSVDLQTEIQTQRYGSEISSLWNSITTDRDFYWPQKSCLIRYAVGQPMGTYTSWSMLATTNHMLARTACKILSINFYKNDVFRICGDDFFCIGISLEQEYSKIIEGIGVLISRTKGYTYHTSKDYLSKGDFSLMPNVVEFVKRVSIDGVEISPVRPKIILESITDPSKINSLLDTIYEKDIPISYLNISKIFDLNWKSNDVACLIAISPHSPCKFMKDIYSLLPEGSNINECLDHIREHDLYDPELERSTLFKHLSKMDFTMESYLESYRSYLEKLIIKKVLPSLRLTNKFIFDNSFGYSEDRPLCSKSRKVKLNTGGLIALDMLLVIVYIMNRDTIQEAIDILREDRALSLDDINKVITLLISSRDFFLILNGLERKIPLSIENSLVYDDIVKNIVKNLSLDLNNVNLDSNNLKFIKIDDVKRVISLKDNPSSTKFLDFFSRKNKVTSIEREYFNTRDGFLSTLSQKAQKAFYALEDSMGRTHTGLGSNLTSKFDIDTGLKGLVLQNIVDYKLTDNNDKLNQFLTTGQGKNIDLTSVRLSSSLVNDTVISSKRFQPSLIQLMDELL
jgi:hypothetical protein